MSFRLRPSAFDAARPLIDRIQALGWIWRGRQELAGLCCVKAWFDGPGWIGALTPWLDHAARVEETDSFVILHFDTPLECDCARLGRVLPLRRVHGALCSFPMTLAGGGDALAGQLLIIDQDERVMTPLAGFRAVDVAAWWSLADIAAEKAMALPQKPRSANDSASRSSMPFDPDGFNAGLDDIRERITRGRRLSRREFIAAIAGGLARLVAWALIISLVVMVAVDLAQGEGGEALAKIVVYAIIFGVIGLIRLEVALIGTLTRTLAKGLQGGKPAAAPSRIAPPRLSAPGFLRRAAGWLVWNSALGTGVRGKYGRRLRELEALFEQGRFDEALRKAVALGAEGKDKKDAKRGWFGDFPLFGPDIRKNLNIRYEAALTPAMGILTDAGFKDIAALYRKQAEACVARGEFERAAFIYAELLNDPAAAVQVFERKGDFETAAKLAQGRRLASSVFVPLWFRAGQKQRALRLAAQYDAFADLVTHVKETDPFHRELVTAWAARLVETGNLARALTLTESYATSMPERRAWILKALDQQEADANLLARALRCLPEEHQDRLRGLLGRFIARSGADHAAERIQLAGHMGNAAFEKAATDGNYFAKRLPLMSLPLLRALLDDEVVHGSDKARLEAALALSEASGQLALRVDLRRLNRIAALAPPKPDRQVVMSGAGGLPGIRAAICITGNRLLTAYDSGALHLTGLDGRRLWSDHVHNIRGFAPIAAEGMIIIVRDEIEGPALSLLDIDGRTHRDIGFFPVAAFCSQATEIGWPVFANGRVVMLDTASLVAAAKKGGGALEHHWEIPVTERGRVCAIRDHPTHVSFLYHRVPGGLLELWTLQKPSLKVECRFLADERRTPRADVLTYGWDGGSYFHAPSEDGKTVRELVIPTETYSLATERKLLAESQSWLLLDQYVAVAGNLVWCASQNVPKAASVPTTSQENARRNITLRAAFTRSLGTMFTVQFPDAGWVRASMHPALPHMAAFDNLGRIIVFDAERSKILFRNDGK